jgi:PKD domain-containing protein
VPTISARRGRSPHAPRSTNSTLGGPRRTAGTGRRTIVLGLVALLVGSMVVAILLLSELSGAGVAMTSPWTGGPPRYHPSPAPFSNLGLRAQGAPVSGPAPLVSNFTSTAWSGTAPYSYRWTFGDGGSSYGRTVSHAYLGAGNFTARVTVTDALFQRASQWVSVRVVPNLTGVAASLLGGSAVAVTSNRFWSIDAQTACASCISTNTTVDRFLTSTPFTWVRYGQGSDACNISVNRQYGPSGVATSGCGYNLSALKSWCGAQVPHCHTVLGLPGENNNSREDAAIAKWIVTTVGLQPDYWAIGNEPTGWTHYGIPWTSWRTSDASSATPLAYAYDVKAAIAAVTAVDPSAKFIGVEAACPCNTAWFQDVARVDGGSISAMAFHNYPSSGSTSESLSQFFSPLASASNVTSSVAAVRSAIRGYCGACGTLPLFVNEYNAGPGWSPSNFGGTYSNAVFLAASVVQALRANVTQLTVFNLQSESRSGFGYALLDSHGVVGPNGELFSGVLRHLATGTVYSNDVRSSVSNVWSVATENGSTQSLLIVNANLTHTIALSLGVSWLAGVAGTVYQWDPGHAQPRASGGTILTAYSVPPEGILLIDVPLVVGLAPAKVLGASGGSAPFSWAAVGLGPFVLGGLGILAILTRSDRPAALARRSLKP